MDFCLDELNQAGACGQILPEFSWVDREPNDEDERKWGGSRCVNMM